MSKKENAEVLLLRQTILEAIKDNNLTERMSMIKMRASAVNMSDDDLNALIGELKLQADKQIRTQEVVNKKRKLIVWISALVVIVEWMIGLALFTPPKELSASASELSAKVSQLVAQTATLSAIMEENVREAKVMATELTTSAKEVATLAQNVANDTHNLFTMSTALWLLLVNIVSVLIIVIVIAVVVNKKVK